MMPAVRVTLALVATLVLLVGLDVGIHTLGPGPVEELPRLEDVDLVTVRRVSMTTGDQVVVLERIGDSGNWKLTAPIEGPADSAAVRELVKRLRRGVPMQVKLEDGNLDEYGLASGSATRLQIYEDERDDAVVDIYIGKDSVGGASFVRFPDDDSVYRAQIGGRHRFEREPRDWRDPGIVSLEPDAATGLSLRIGESQSLNLRKVEDGWQIPEDPDFPVDVETVREVLNRIGGLRAGRVLPADFPIEGAPTLEIVVSVAGIDSIELEFYIEGELAYVKRNGRDEVFQIASSVPRRLALPLPAWQDRQMIQVDRPQILRMTLHDPANGDYIVEQQADSNWKMIQPPNVDVNLRDATQAALRLSKLRAEGLAAVTPEEAGFPSPRWIELEMRDGSKAKVELGRRVPGAEGQPRVFIRTPDQPDRIGVMRTRDLFEISKGWSR